MNEKNENQVTDIPSLIKLCIAEDGTKKKIFDNFLRRFEDAKGDPDKISEPVYDLIPLLPKALKKFETQLISFVTKQTKLKQLSEELGKEAQFKDLNESLKKLVSLEFTDAPLTKFFCAITDHFLQLKEKETDDKATKDVDKLLEKLTDILSKNDPEKYFIAAIYGLVSSKIRKIQDDLKIQDDSEKQSKLKELEVFKARLFASEDLTKIVKIYQKAKEVMPEELSELSKYYVTAGAEITDIPSLIASCIKQYESGLDKTNDPQYYIPMLRRLLARVKDDPKEIPVVAYELIKLLPESLKNFRLQLNNLMKNMAMIDKLKKALGKYLADSKGARYSGDVDSIRSLHGKLENLVNLELTEEWLIKFLCERADYFLKLQEEMADNDAKAAIDRFVEKFKSILLENNPKMYFRAVVYNLVSRSIRENQNIPEKQDALKALEKFRDKLVSPESSNKTVDDIYEEAKKFVDAAVLERAREDYQKSIKAADEAKESRGAKKGSSKSASEPPSTFGRIKQKLKKTKSEGSIAAVIHEDDEGKKHEQRLRDKEATEKAEVERHAAEAAKRREQEEAEAAEKKLVQEIEDLSITIAMYQRDFEKKEKRLSEITSELNKDENKFSGQQFEEEESHLKSRIGRLEKGIHDLRSEKSKKQDDLNVEQRKQKLQELKKKQEKINGNLVLLKEQVFDLSKMQGKNIKELSREYRLAATPMEKTAVISKAARRSGWRGWIDDAMDLIRYKSDDKKLRETTCESIIKNSIEIRENEIALKGVDSEIKEIRVVDRLEQRMAMFGAHVKRLGEDVDSLEKKKDKIRGMMAEKTELEEVLPTLKKALKELEAQKAQQEAKRTTPPSSPSLMKGSDKPQ